MRPLLPLLLFAAAALAQEYGETHRLKVEITGDSRKIALFVPKNVKRGEALPLLVAIPAAQGRSFQEIGQWQQPAYDKRFAVFSVDVTTASIEKPWHYKDQLDMQRDMEAVTKGLEVALAKARELEVVIDESATVITGHSGATFLALWLGIRRPDLFLGVCGRSVVFFKETVEFGKFDTVKPNYSQPILLYRGELDALRPKKETDLAKRTLDAAGWKKVALRIVPKMVHESKPEVCVEWFEELLKKTAKGRKEARRIREELPAVRADVETSKPGALTKLVRLAEREAKAGFAVGAQALLDEVEAKAKAEWERGENLAADQQLAEAIEIFKGIEKAYKPLTIAKEARSRRAKIANSDDYKAAELLAKAKRYLEKGLRDKAFPILEKIEKKYPKTAAADEARHLLQG